MTNQRSTTAARASTTATGPAARARNLFAIASGKGGVGKTWFSITLTHGLARMGKRTLLFDADLGLANVDIQLGLMPQRDLGGVISGRIALPQAKVRFEDGNFDIIAGRSGSGSLATLPSHRLQSLGDDLVRLSDSYDHVVMDLGAGLDRTVRSLSQRAGTVLVVTSTEPTSLTDAYAFIKITHQTNPNSDVRVVVNTADTPAEGRRTFDTLAKACRNFLGFEPQLAGVVRRDKRVIEAIRAQIPLLTRSPSSAAASDVEAIVDRLIT